MAREMDRDQLLKAMLGASARVLQKRWPAVRDYAEMEFQKLLLQAEHIKKLKVRKRITEQEARALMDLQRNAMRSVLLTLEGVGVLTVERMIEEALRVVRETVNKAIGGGWRIL